MKTLYKQLILGLVALFCSSALFAVDCPLIGGYSLRSHDANNVHCTYASNKVVKLALRPHAANQCPRLILTDPHFQAGNCHLDVRLSKCLCTITQINH